MHHSESEQEALDSSIEFVPKDETFHKSLIVTLEQGHAPPPAQSNLSRRRITILNEGAEYSNVFDQAQIVILGMRDSYQQMFKNWKIESEMNSELSTEVKNLKITIGSQKKITKKLLDEKSQIQEELARSERQPKLQNKVADLEAEIKSLKLEVSQLKTENARKDTVLNETTKTLQFYRDEFGGKDEGTGEQDTFRKRTIPIPIKRFYSTPENRRVTRSTEKRGSKGQAPSIKLFAFANRK